MKSYRTIFLERESEKRRRQERNVNILLTVGGLYLLGHIVWFVSKTFLK